MGIACFFFLFLVFLLLPAACTEDSIIENIVMSLLEDIGFSKDRLLSANLRVESYPNYGVVLSSDLHLLR